MKTAKRSATINPDYSIPPPWDGTLRKPNGTRRHILSVSRTLLTKENWPDTRESLHLTTGEQVGVSLRLSRVLRMLPPGKNWKFEIEHIKSFRYWVEMERRWKWGRRPRKL